MTETEARIALNMLEGVGPIGFRRLLDVFGSAIQILSTKEKELRSVENVRPNVAHTIATWEKRIDLASELKRISDDGVEVIDWESPYYPSLLKTIADPPIVLYVWGSLLPNETQCIGVVGTRTPTVYGCETSRKLSYQLAYSGLTVVSGLARGVDTEAHMAALAAKGRTWAILGGGLRKIYPRENRSLACKIAEQGAVLTEYPMESPADRRTFPMRNRIIAGSTFGLLVVEAGQKSGAMISATQACDFGRTVYAVPGKIDQPMAMGTNRLIQQGAKLVMSAQDIFDELGLLFRSEPILKKKKPNLLPDESMVYEAVLDSPTHVDEVIRCSSLPIPQTMAVLFKLELKRLIKQLPGQHYVKLCEN